MTWVAICTLAAVSFGLKMLGPVVVGDRTLSRRSSAIVGLLPVPMLAALVIVGAFADGHTLHLDARAPAVAVAGLRVARRAPFLLVICAAAATAAALRLVG
jgi:branched-subunit amino acid transport protein